MAKHNWMGVDIELSSGTRLITDFNNSKQDLWALQETGGSQDGASILVTAGKACIIGPVYSFWLNAGESAVFGSGVWAKVNAVAAAASAVNLLPSRIGQVEFISCMNVLKWLQTSPQFRQFVLELDDIGCPDRGFIRNTTPVPSYTEILIALGSNKLLLVNGEAAEKVSGQWVRHITVASANQSNVFVLNSVPPQPPILTTMSCGQVCIQYSSDCNFMTQPSVSPYCAVLRDQGSKPGARIKNVTPGNIATYIEIWVPGNNYPFRIVQGIEVEFDGVVWKIAKPANTAIWAPMSFGNVGMKTVERHPIPDGRAKKCTCGTQSGPDGGICSDYCDLVRTDD